MMRIYGWHSWSFRGDNKMRIYSSMMSTMKICRSILLLYLVSLTILLHCFSGLCSTGSGDNCALFKTARLKDGFGDIYKCSQKVEKNRLLLPLHLCNPLWSQECVDLCIRNKTQSNLLKGQCTLLPPDLKWMLQGYEKT